jgi:hypothetical protein
MSDTNVMALRPPLKTERPSSGRGAIAGSRKAKVREVPAPYLNR